MARVRTGESSMRNLLREVCEIYVNFAGILLPLIAAEDPALAAALTALVNICISSPFTRTGADEITT